MRSFIDFVFAGIGLIVLLPVIFVVSIVIVTSSGWPILFIDDRVGYKGKIFRILKFRTMRVDTRKTGSAITTLGDSRITPIGKFLRWHKIDELPQLLNVIRGDMSIVGPRPERPEIVKLYSEKQRGILAYRPGITSPASLRYRNESELFSTTNWESEYMENVLPDKIEIDLNYLATRTVGQDILITIRSVRSSFFS